MYHIVDEPESSREHRFCTPPAEFARQMAWLVNSGYTPVSLDQIISYLDGGSIGPEKPIHITFDDGFEGIFIHALPHLKRHKIPATLFAVSDRAGGTNDWMHNRGFPRRKILSWQQLKELESAGISIGSHTRQHARLTELSDEDMVDEISSSRKILEDNLGKKVDYFAYPYGLCNDQVIDTVKESGYTAACSTLSGFNRPGENPFKLRRIDIFGTDQLWQFKQKLGFGTNETDRLFKLKYYFGRIGARIGL